MHGSKKLMKDLAIAGLCGCVAILSAQEPNPTTTTPEGQNPITKQENGVYLYKVKVVQRNLDAVNYLHRSGSTRIAFKGTPLLPRGSGDAKVTSERGGIHIEARFKGLSVISLYLPSGSSGPTSAIPCPSPSSAASSPR